MSAKTFEISEIIAATPATVIAYVADVRNRPLYFPLLKSITNIKGDPSAVGTSWTWTFGALGIELQGQGRCLKHEPGKLYSFSTDGGIASTCTYIAVPEGKGTRLTISLEYEVPEKAKSIIPKEEIAAKMQQTEAERVIHNLKTILE
jgi:carbon monoxide dehydrogenase subunit G